MATGINDNNNNNNNDFIRVFPLKGGSSSVKIYINPLHTKGGGIYFTQK